MAGDSGKTQKEILEEFQTLRNEQRILVQNLSTIQMDLKEHKSVIQILKTVDKKRKCFRLIDDVLCGRTVEDVLPQLVESQGYLEKLVVINSEKLNKIDLEINKFKKENNITGHEVAGSTEPKSEMEKSEI